MKHAVLGVGAIGGLVATALGSLDEEVVLIVRPEKLADYPAALSLERPSGTLTALAKAVSRVTQPVDVLWIATKTYQLQAALEAVQSAPSAVVPLLNGVDHIAMLRARYGQNHVIPATIAVEAERLAPGRFLQRSPFVRLNLASSAEPLLGAIVTRLSGFGFTCQFVQNEKTLLWSKLCFLAPFALVTSASGKNKGEIYTDPGWKAKLDSAVVEACGVARRVQGFFSPLAESGIRIPVAIASSMECYSGAYTHILPSRPPASLRFSPASSVATAFRRRGFRSGRNFFRDASSLF